MLVESTTEVTQLNADEIGFACPWCNSQLKISIWTAGDTTGPCPHCADQVTFLVGAGMGVRTGSGSVRHADKVPPEDAVPTGRSPSKWRTSRGTFACAGVLILAILGGAAYFVMQHRLAASSAPVVARFAMPGIDQNDANAEPFRVLKLFYEAQSLTERMEHVFNPIRHQPEMSRSFAADQVAKVPMRAFISSPALKYSTASAAFLLGERDPKQGPPIVARFVGDRSGVKLDWELFHQSSMNTLGKFGSSPVPGVHRFFAEVRYLENARGRAVCVAISDLGSTKPAARVAVDQRSDMAHRITSLLGAGESRPMIIHLHWDELTKRIGIASIEPMQPRFGVLREPLNLLVDVASEGIDG